MSPSAERPRGQRLSRYGALHSVHGAPTMKPRYFAVRPVIVLSEAERPRNLAELATLKINGLYQKPPRLESPVQQMYDVRSAKGGTAPAAALSP